MDVISGIFIFIYRFFKKFRLLFFLFTALIIGAVAYFAAQIKLEEDISKMMSGDKKVAQLNFVFQNSKFLDKLTFTLSLKDSNTTNTETLISSADSLVQRMEHRFKPSKVKEITARVYDDGSCKCTRHFMIIYPFF